MAPPKAKQDLPDDFEEHILDTDIKQEMEASFLEYAYSVIYSRALPDARCRSGPTTPHPRCFVNQMVE